MEYVKLNEVCEIIMGQSPDSDSYNEDGNGIAFFQGKSEFGRINPVVKTYCTQPKKLARPLDILMSVRAPVGDVNISNIDCCIGRGLCTLRVKNMMDYKYLYYYLSKQKVFLNSKSTGSTFKAINKTILSELLVPNEKAELQRKIVGILDKAQELIDKRKEQIEALDKLVKSQFIEMFGEPIQNNKGWQKIKLETLGIWKTGGTPSRSNAEYFNGSIPWLSSGELNDKYCYGSNECITEEAICNSSAKLIEPQSLLLGMYDTAALKSTINIIECTCNQAIAYSKLNSEVVNVEFVYYCIQIGKDFYKSQQRGVRQKNLNLTMVKELEIIFPPLDLQNQFADFVKQVDKLKFKMEQSLKELEDNFECLMQKAFKGELLEEK